MVDMDDTDRVNLLLSRRGSVTCSLVHIVNCWAVQKNGYLFARESLIKRSISYEAK